jgi:hypothetical protein
MDFLNRQRRARLQRGSAYVETVFVVPVIFLLFAGLIDTSLMIHDWMMANQAARVAARRASLYEQDCQVDDKRDAAVETIAFLSDELVLSQYQESQVQVEHMDQIHGLDLCDSGLLQATVPVHYSHFLLGESVLPVTLEGRATAMNENDS